ncbi:amino acid transporter [Hysterangium stoloniferum]|nr:amino acid transporter [Hysterangium stoloniferum]
MLNLPRTNYGRGSKTSASPLPVSEPQAVSNQNSDARLRELGYTPQFKRELSFWGVMGVGFCTIGILTGMSSAFQTGYVSVPLLRSSAEICSLFMFLIALCLAEICSALPTMGGLYYWVCAMKPEYPALGFTTGLLYTFAMIFTGCSGNLSTALYIASLAEVGTGASLTRVEVAAIAWGINILSGIINTVGTRAIGTVSKVNLWWTLGGTLFLVISLLVKAPHKNTAAFVFTDLENFTGWGNSGFVVLLGFLQAVYTLEGCETAAQVAEEAQRAEILAPVAIVSSVAGSWFIGLIYMLALLFSVQSISSVQETSFSIPIAQLYFDAVGRRLTIVSLVIICSAQFFAAITAWTASSRLFYALARDNALPFKSKFMSLTDGQAPWLGVWISVLIGSIICCAYIGSPVAFNAILSSAAISVMLSYAMPILVRVIWPDRYVDDRGPFHLGKYSRITNFASLLFSLFVCILFVLPTARPVTVLNMNYAIVAIGGLILLVLVAWFMYGKTHFKGSVSTIGEEGAGAGREEKEY